MRAFGLIALAAVPPLLLAAYALSIDSPAAAYEVERYTVYCANDRIEISFWDLEQMIVRRGTPVCRFAGFTSYSSAITFAGKNFGGEGKPCSCQ